MALACQVAVKRWCHGRVGVPSLRAMSTGGSRGELEAAIGAPTMVGRGSIEQVRREGHSHTQAYKHD